MISAILFNRVFNWAWKLNQNIAHCKFVDAFFCFNTPLQADWRGLSFAQVDWSDTLTMGVSVVFTKIVSWVWDARGPFCSELVCSILEPQESPVVSLAPFLFDGTLDETRGDSGVICSKSHGWLWMPELLLLALAKLDCFLCGADHANVGLGKATTPLKCLKTHGSSVNNIMSIEHCHQVSVNPRASLKCAKCWCVDLDHTFCAQLSSRNSDVSVSGWSSFSGSAFTSFFWWHIEHLFMTNHHLSKALFWIHHGLLVSVLLEAASWAQIWLSCFLQFEFTYFGLELINGRIGICHPDMWQPFVCFVSLFGRACLGSAAFDWVKPKSSRQHASGILKCSPGNSRRRMLRFHTEIKICVLANFFFTEWHAVSLNGRQQTVKHAFEFQPITNKLCKMWVS